MSDVLERFTAPGRAAQEAPAADVAPIETPAETPIETPIETPNPTEAPVGKPSETPAETPTEVPKPTASPEYISKLREFAGEKFKIESDDDIKNIFESYNKISGEAESLKSRLGIVDEIEKWVEEESSKYDPKSVIESRFGEGSYQKVVVASELSKRLGGDFDTAYKFINGVDKMSDLEVNAKYVQFLTPGISEKDASEVVLEKIGIDLEGVDNIKDIELTSRQKARLAMEASEVKNKLNRTIEGIEYKEPENPIKNIKTKFDERKTKSETLKGQWEEAMTPLKASFDKIQIDDDFDFEIPVEDRDILSRFIVAAAQQGIEPSEANKQMVLKRAKDAIEDQNRLKIRAAYRSHIVAEERKKWDAERHNLSPLETTKSPAEGVQSEAQAQWRKSVGLTSKRN